MQREFNITPLLINHQSQPSKNSWVKIFIYEPAEPDVLQSRGTMYAVLSLSAKANIDFAAVMQMILEQLHSQYFQQPSGGILQALEAALDGVHKKLILMGQKDKKYAENFDFNLLTAVSWGTVLYFGQLGSSRAALYRDGKLFDIDEGPQKSTSLYLSSGVLRTNDKVILGTSQLFKRFNKTQLKQILTRPDDQIVELLEKELDPGPLRGEQSGIVLSVDIKHVPSIKDESLHIQDASKISENSNKELLHKLNPLKLFSLIGAGLQSVGHALSWRLFGVVPLLPILIVLIATAALLYSIFGGEVWQPKADLNQEIVQSASDSLIQAQEVAAINPDRALDLMETTRTYINQGLSTHPNHPQLLSLKQQLNDLRQDVLIITELTPSQIAEVAINPTQPKLALQNDSLLAIDQQQQSIVSISEFGQISTLAKDSQIDPSGLLASTVAGVVLITPQGAHAVNTGQIGQPSTIPTSAKIIASAQYDSYSYAMALDGHVYRVPRTSDGIGSISRYFTQPVSSQGLVDLAVDGSVYLLRQDGTVEAYFNGVKQLLTLERASLASESKAIFAPVQSQNLYLFKQDSLIAWTKEGEYLGQFVFNNTENWQMVAINEAGDTLYVLTDSHLYSASLP